MTTPPQQPGADNARPIRVGRVFIGIGVTLAAYIVFGCGLPALISQFGPSPLSALALGAPALLFVGALVFGIIQVVRGDRGIGVGVLIAGALVPIVLAGVCIALLAALTGPQGIG
jgi:hypothetical protein